MCTCTPVSGWPEVASTTEPAIVPVACAEATPDVANSSAIAAVRRADQADMSYLLALGRRP